MPGCSSNLPVGSSPAAQIPRTKMRFVTAAQQVSTVRQAEKREDRAQQKGPSHPATAAERLAPLLVKVDLSPALSLRPFDGITILAGFPPSASSLTTDKIEYRRLLARDSRNLNPHCRSVQS